MIISPEGNELNYLPNLQFYNGEKWVESGVISSRVSENFHGFYRYKIKD